MDNNDELNKLNDLNRRLYSTNPDAIKKRPRRMLRPVEYIIPRAWGFKKNVQDIEQKLTVRQPILKKFFLASLIIFFCALAFAGFMFYRGTRTISTENVDITVLGNSFTNGGEELPIEIQIKNDNAVPLDLADLLIEYPRGSAGALASDMNRTRKAIGTIEAGKTYIETTKLVLYGEQGTTREVKIRLQYRVPGSNAIFIKDKYYTVNINSAPLDIVIDAPKSITPNQDITLNIKASLATDQIAQNMRLLVEYPPGFEFKSATPNPRYGTTLWDLGDLAYGTEKTITIVGTVKGQENEQQSFRVFAGSADPSDESRVGVIYNSLAHTITLEQPFLDAKIFIDGKNAPAFNAKSRQTIPVQIEWTNNLPVSISDVEVVVALSGNVFNRNAVTALGGFYDSSNNQIVWNKNTTSGFDLVEPGDKGRLSFSLQSLSLITPQGVVQNPSIDLAVSIRGRQSGGGGADASIDSFEKGVIKFISDLQVATGTYYNKGPLRNSGVVPPAADKKTTYTVNWVVTNSVNPVSGAEVRATLPIYVTWKNSTSPVSENITYDTVTREVIWKIDSVGRASGTVPARREAYFQVELKPSLLQVGSVPAITSEVVLTGTDTFTGALLRSQGRASSTQLNSEEGATATAGVVTQ